MELQESSNKATLVACSYAQIFVVVFVETYSPVIRLTSLRLLFAIAAQLGLMIRQVVVDTAFFHADNHEEIHINHQKGCRFRKELLQIEKGIVWTKAITSRMV